MKNLFNSLSGALTLAFLHLLLELWRAFLDFSYVLPDYSGGAEGAMAAISLLYVLIFGGWLLALNAARVESRRGVLASIAFSAFFWIVIDISTVFFYCPGGCEALVFDIGTYVAIVIGGAAIYSLARNLKAAQNGGGN